jgi:phospholipase C
MVKSTPTEQSMYRSCFPACSYFFLITKFLSQRYIAGYPQNTIYNNLAASGISWKNYFQEIPSLVVFDQLRTSLGNYKQWGTFLSDAKAGTLPSVSFLDPSYFSILNCVQENDNHPPSDVAEGEALLKQVYEAVRASPQWNETLLIVTYDEHGG